MATNISGQVQNLFPTTQTNSNQYDPTLMGTLTDIINAARTQSNVPYQAYPGQRYAQQTPEELQANQAVRDNFMATQPMYAQSQNLINQGTGQLNNLTQNMGQWNSQQASQYMNPYISNVVQAQNANMLNNANIQRNQIRGNAAQAGAFGGGRQFVAEAQMDDNLQRQLNDSTSNLLMQGYNTAYDQFNKDRQFGLEGVKQYGAQGDLISGLAGARNNAYYGDVNNLSTVGKNNRDIAQANLDYDYSNFQNQRDYGKNQLGWISGLLNGTNIGQFQTGTTQTNRTQLPASGSSFTSDLMTGLGYAANLANTDIGKSIGSWISGLFAEGGYVQKYAEGGRVSYRGKDANKISVPDNVTSLETNFKDRLDYTTGGSGPYITLEVPSLEGLDLNNLINLEASPKGYKVTLRNSEYAKGGQVKGYAEGGPTQVDILNARRRARLEAARRNQPFPVEPDDMRITGMLKGIGNTLGAVPSGIAQAYDDMAVRPLASLYDFATAPYASQTVPGFAGGMVDPQTGQRVDAGLAGPPALQEMGTIGSGPPRAPQSISDLINSELDNANQPPSIGELMMPQQQQQQAAMEPNPMDYFTYNGGPLDALMQPNPLLMQGLYGKLNTNDLGEMWAAANQIDALNNYEDLRGNRMQTDTQRGSAIGELQERRANRNQTAALEQRKLEIEELAAMLPDPLKQAQTKLVLAKIGQIGKTKPATAKDILDKVKALNEAKLSGTIDDQRYELMMEGFVNQLDGVGDTSDVDLTDDDEVYGD